MTKQELEQLKSLKLEVKQLQEELHSLPLTKDSVKGSLPEFPYIEQVIKIVGTDEGKAKKVRGKLEKALEELQDMILVMEEWLDTVEDSEIRTILRMKYRNGMRDKEIAVELGYDKSTISKKLSRFFSAK